MSAAEPVKENTEPDNANVGLIATVTLVGAFLVLAIALALAALVRSESTERINEVGGNADLGTVQRLKEEQRAKLEGSPAWLDRAKGQVVLPIDRAMELVTANIRKDPNLATETPPAPPAAAAPDPSTAPPAASADPVPQK